MDPDEQEEFPEPGLLPDMEDFPLDALQTEEDEAAAGIERY